MKRAKSYLYIQIPNLPALLSQKQIPRARNQPLVVVTDTGERGIVRSVSPQAEALGVRVGQMVRDLYRWKNSLDVIPEDPSLRLGIAQQLTAMLKGYSPSVEVRGEDRFLIDLTGTERLWGDSGQVAQQILNRLFEEWNLAASIGVGPSRTVARIAAGVTQAPGICSVEVSQMKSFLEGISVAHLPGVGARTRERLERYGLRTIGELAEVSQELLVETFGAYHGILLARLAQGQDTERLRVTREVNSLHREMPLPEDTLDVVQMESFLAYLCGRVALDLQKRKLTTRRITLRIRYADGLVRQINQSLSASTALETELMRESRPLLQQILALRRARVASLGVSVSRLRPGSPQSDLFDLRGTRRQEEIADDICAVRRRYGFNALLTGRACAALT